MPSYTSTSPPSIGKQTPQQLLIVGQLKNRSTSKEGDLEDVEVSLPLLHPAYHNKVVASVATSMVESSCVAIRKAIAVSKPNLAKLAGILHLRW
jgi:hypothetical protein